MNKKLFKSLIANLHRRIYNINTENTNEFCFLFGAIDMFRKLTPVKELERLREIKKCEDHLKSLFEIMNGLKENEIEEFENKIQELKQ